MTNRGTVRLSIAATALCSSCVGCATNSAGILSDVAAIQRPTLQQSDTTVWALVKRLDAAGHDSVTEAYIRAPTEADRAMLMFCLQLTRNPVYIPLWCYVARYSPNPGVRS
jgi:hypothetical protein